MRKRISSNTSVIEVHQIIPCETGGQHNLVPLVALDGFQYVTEWYRIGKIY